jgi:hypothetical protein
MQMYSFFHSRERESLYPRPPSGQHLVHRGPSGLEIGHLRVNNLEDVTMQSIPPIPEAPHQRTSTGIKA